MPGVQVAATPIAASQANVVLTTMLSGNGAIGMALLGAIGRKSWIKGQEPEAGERRPGSPAA